jgi:hypothetical protein
MITNLPARPDEFGLGIAGQAVLFEKRGMAMIETITKIIAALGFAATVCDPLTVDSAKYKVPDPEPGEKPGTTPAEKAASENRAEEELAQKSPGTFPQPAFKWRNLPVDQ